MKIVGTSEELQKLLNAINCVGCDCSKCLLKGNKTSCCEIGKADLERAGVEVQITDNN